MSLKDTEILETRFARTFGMGDRVPADLRTNAQASPHVSGQIYAMVELLVTLLLGMVVGHIYVYTHLEQHDFLQTYIWPSILIVLTFGYLNYRSKLYDVEKLSRFLTFSSTAVGNLIGAFLIVALIGLAIGAADQFSRLWFGVWLLSSVVAVWTMRAAAARVFSSQAVQGAICRRAAIFGTDAPLRRAVEALGMPDSGVRIAGIFGPTRGGDLNTGVTARDGGLAELIDFGQRNDVDTVIIALPPSQRRHLEDMLSELSVLPAEIKLLPDIETHMVPFRGISSLAQVQFIDLQQKPISGWGHMMKAIEDYVIASIATVLLAPFLLLVAIAVKLESPGPVFFKQQRHGLNNQVITVFKFRTMHVQPEGQSFRQATRNDNRVTRVGRILRRLSIDELPQLFNVLRGEMSIVGPRPHAVEQNAAYAGLLPMYNNRHRVKPGITGWAQVNDFRGPTFTVEAMNKRLEYDLYYIENWSILFDISIIAATPFIGLVHKNAV